MSDEQRIKELEAENARLRRVVAATRKICTQARAKQLAIDSYYSLADGMMEVVTALAALDAEAQ